MDSTNRRTFSPASVRTGARRLCASVLCASLAAAAGSCSDSTAPRVRQVPASLDIVAGNAQEGTVGAELLSPLVARVLDQAGNPIAGQLVNFRVTAGGGSVFAGSSITNRDGEARERWTLGTSTAAAQEVEARAVDNSTGEPLVFAVFRATARAAAPDTVRAVSGHGQSAVAAAAFPESLLVRVADRYGNPVPGVTVAWSAPVAAGTLTKTSDVTTATGHASTKLTAGTSAGAYTVTAAVGERAAVFDVRVTAAPPATLAVHAGNGQAATVATAVPVDPAVRVLDTNGNPAVDIPVDFVTADGSSIGASTVHTNDSGIARVSWTLKPAAGTNTLQASVAGLPPVTFTATGVAGPAARVAKAAGDAQTAPPGSAVPIRPMVHVTDQYENPVAGASVVFAVAAGGGSVTGSNVSTGADGLAAVGSWTLGPTKGANLLTASAGEGLVVTFAATACERSPDVSVAINQPGAGAIVGDELRVVAAVSSRYSVASVRAEVGAVQAPLSYSTNSARWEGTLSLDGLPRDTVQLVVTARDVNGSATDALVRFVHDRAPVVSVTGPDNGSVARPSIALSAECADDDPAGCRSLVVEAQGSFGSARTLMTGQSRVSGTVSLSNFDGQGVTLVFIGTDSRGRVMRVDRSILVESSTKLREIATVDGLAMDLRGDRVLYRRTDGSVALRPVSSGVEETVYADTRAGFGPQFGFVTSVGALLAVNRPSSPLAAALEWRNGTLLDLGALNSSQSLRVSGDYAIFSNGATLTRRSLVSGTNEIISTTAGNIDNGVAPNGDVAFWSSNYRVYRYRNGTTTLLTPDDGTGRWNTWAETDGVNVVYRKHGPCCNAQTYAIVLHDGSGETVLAPARSLEPWPGRDYAVNAGWTAFTRLDEGSVLQVWTRSPAGELRQVSSFGTHSSVAALGSDGTVIFSNGGRRYLAAPSGSATNVMSELGTVFWRDGRFVVLLGRTAFTVTP